MKETADCYLFFDVYRRVVSSCSEINVRVFLKKLQFYSLTMYSLRIRHARQVVLVCNNKERILTGDSMKKLAIVEGGEDGGVSIVVNAGKIECIALDRIIDQKYENCSFVEEIDASGMCVLPGKLNM